jgi:hypothetical protein
VATISPPNIVQQKLAAFERLEAEFEQCFQFLEEVHGQKRFSVFPVEYTVRYLHALWVGECKTCLLSVARTVKGYEGRQCLELLQRWQEDGDTASIVDFLTRKLDTLPLAGISRQIQVMQRAHTNDNLVRRLVHGRMVMLNRGINLFWALDSIFALSEEELQHEVSLACERYGHRPEQIAQQLQELDSPLFAFVPHRVLAQRNMLVMNKVGVNVLSKPADHSDWRSWLRSTSTSGAILSPFAELVVRPYLDMTSPDHNNIKRDVVDLVGGL